MSDREGWKADGEFVAWLAKRNEVAPELILRVDTEGWLDGIWDAWRDGRVIGESTHKANERVAELEGELGRLEACLVVNRKANASKDERITKLQAQLERANNPEPPAAWTQRTEMVSDAMRRIPKPAVCPEYNGYHGCDFRCVHCKRATSQEPRPMSEAPRDVLIRVFMDLEHDGVSFTCCEGNDAPWAYLADGWIPTGSADEDGK